MSSKKNSSQVLRYSLGLDVSKDHFDACLASLGANFEQHFVATARFDNNPKGFKRLLKWLNKHATHKDAPQVVVVEATGVYHEPLAHYLHSKDKHVSVLLANRVKAYARSLEYKSKTDAIDARILARLGLERNLPAWTPPSVHMQQIKQLMRERYRLQQEATRLKNQLHAMKYRHVCNEVVKEMWEERLEIVEAHIAKIEEEVQKIAQQDEQLRENLKYACSAPGIGWLTAIIILAETNNFALFTSRAQLASYAGYDVRQHQSGSSVRKQGRISKKGNVYLRAAMYFPALVAIRHTHEMKALYERVFGRTNCKMKGCVAVQRKLLLLVYTLVKKKEKYQARYHEQKQAA